MIHNYSVNEERLNVYTHGIACIISFLFFIYLITTDILINNFNTTRCLYLSLFSISSICTFFISAKYHSEKTIKNKILLRKIDHVFIFINIFGVFIPVCYFLSLPNMYFLLFMISELLLVIFGIIFKVKSKVRYNSKSIGIYIFMLIPFFFILPKLILKLSNINVCILSITILTCLLGIPFYLMKRIKYTHTIWHIFVTISSIFSNIFMYNLIH